MKHKIGITIFYYLLKCLNVVQLSINLKNFETKLSKKSFLWSIIFTGAYISHEIFIGRIAHNLKTDYGSASRKGFPILNIAAYVFILLCIAWSFYKMKLSLELIKKAKNIYQQLTCFDEPWKFQCYINQFLIKYLVTLLIRTSVDVTFFIAYSKASFILILAYTPILGLKFFVSSVILMQHSILLLLLKSSFSQVNKIIKNQFIKFKTPQNNEISKEIEALAQIYSNLCQMYQMIMSLISIPLILNVGFNFCVFENSVLMLYGNIKGGFIVDRIILNFLWMVFKVRDVYLVFKFGDGVSEKVRFEI